MMVPQPKIFFLSILLFFANMGGALEIQQKPIQFSEHRIQLMREYVRSHYGNYPRSLEMEPQMIVVHWTALPDLESSFRAFNREELPGGRKALSGAGAVNVSSHFLVDRDGTVYQLMPDNWMARHVIGLNACAIGIENVGGVGGKEDLTVAQLISNAELVAYLKQKYPSITYLLGHHEYLGFQGHPLWLERDPKYRTIKADPGPQFMVGLRALEGSSFKLPPVES